MFFKLDKLIEEQKNLLNRLEEKKATMKPEEKSQIMTLIKSLTISIEKAKEDLLKLVQTTSKRRSVSDVSVFSQFPDLVKNAFIRCLQHQLSSLIAF
jgi:hypothetical protein